jgi:acyl dehydratase
MSARFVAPVYPGDTLSVARWRLDDDATVLAGYHNGDKPVITGGFGGRFV